MSSPQQNWRKGQNRFCLEAGVGGWRRLEKKRDEEGSLGEK
jgi:hypothetical protein